MTFLQMLQFLNMHFLQKFSVRACLHYYCLFKWFTKHLTAFAFPSVIHTKPCKCKVLACHWGQLEIPYLAGSGHKNSQHHKVAAHLSVAHPWLKSPFPRHPKNALLGWDLWSPSEYRELKKPVWTDLSFMRIHTITSTATAWSADTWQDESMISCCLCQILTPPSKCKIRDIRLVNTFPSFHYVILVSSCKL